MTVDDRERLSVQLLACFENEGFTRSEPTILQPADPFLDLSGEDIRRRLVMVQGASGPEQCLRPEYTIPLVQTSIHQNEQYPAHFCYCGPVFRLRKEGQNEFVQSGFESFGRPDREAADADCLALVIDAFKSIQVLQPFILMGDVGLLETIIKKLGISENIRRRILRKIIVGADNSTLFEQKTRSGLSNQQGLLTAIAGHDKSAAKAFVEDVLSIAGVHFVGGRSASDIAERFLEQAENNHAPDSVNEQAQAALVEYLDMSGNPDSIAAHLKVFALKYNLDLSEDIDSFEARTGFMAAQGLDISTIEFRTRFVRNLNYYTGMIFELYQAPDFTNLKPLAAGGRYDRLFEHLGAAEAVPAIGCALWLERLVKAEVLS